MPSKHAGGIDMGDVNMTPQERDHLRAVVTTPLFLGAVALTFDNPNPSESWQDDVRAHNIIYELKDDPAKQTILNEIARQMNYPDNLFIYGLQGRVKRDNEGNIVELDFTHTDTNAEYQKKLAVLEHWGMTPAQADASLAAQDPQMADRNRG